MTNLTGRYSDLVEMAVEQDDKTMRHILVPVALLLFVAEVFAAPRSWDVFREYVWAGPWVNGPRWQRVTGPRAQAEGAKEFLPNPVNAITIDDLDLAGRAEVYIEMLLCHTQTIDKRIRVNGNKWLAIPEPENIPDRAGVGPPHVAYQYMWYPCVDIPLEQLKAGENTFEMTCRGSEGLGGWWPQWIVYGVTFRVYYDGGKPHAGGSIVSPRAGDAIDERPVIECEVDSAEVNSVDIIADYEDFDWEGDGSYRQWHYRFSYGKMRNHVGTASAAPWRVEWDNEWVPTQADPVSLMARITDKTGVSYMTAAVGDVRMSRPQTVRMYKPRRVPKDWATRAGEMDYCLIDIGDDLSGAVAARMFVATWNGHGASVIGINAQKIVTNIGLDHDLSYDVLDVPLEYLKEGVNTPFTYSDTLHHGIEVQWPGPVLMVKYDVPEGENIEGSERE